MRARADCAALVGRGSIRINRQPTDKAHARLRVGDVLTVPVRGQVRVLRVVKLAVRRGPPADALSALRRGRRPGSGILRRTLKAGIPPPLNLPARGLACDGDVP